MQSTALWPHTGEEYRPLLPYHETSLHILSSALNPLDKHKWRRKPWYWRLFKVLKVSRWGWEKCTVLGDVSLMSPLLPRSLWSWCCCSLCLWWTPTETT